MFIDDGIWNEQVRERLRHVIRANSGRQLDAVFDFDNTIMCRNMGDPVADLLTATGLMQRLEIPEYLSVRHVPQHTVPELAPGISINDYYEQYLAEARGSADQDRMYADAYAWAVWTMAGISPQQIVALSEQVYDGGSGIQDSVKRQGVTLVPGSCYARPFCYPQIIDLMADLLENDFRIWVVTSSTPWTVRWVINNVINVELEKRGFTKRVSPINIFGISSLLLERTGKVMSDFELAQSNDAYRRLDPECLQHLRLTPRLCYPLSCFKGKAGLIKRFISKDPFLVAGDSANDLHMFGIARNCLWINPLERKDKRVWNALLADPNAARWLVQPTVSGEMCGFQAQFPEHLDLRGRLNESEFHSAAAA